MWATAPLPVYSGDRRSARRKGTKTGAAPSSTLLSPPPLPPTSSAVSSYRHPNSITDLLEPAIDGPPSPESLRALSNQMKRTSFLDKHQSQQTTSSGSSSLRSLASADRPSWEHALEGNALSRKSSGRSTSSSMQPRERPDSVQIFGKTLFNRRGRLKRESSTQSSSGSSLYSAEMPFEAGPPPTSAANRDTFIPGIFNRRRTMKSEPVAEESEARKKFQISGPYNFQHLTHTEREQVPNLQRASRMALQSKFSALRSAQSPTDGTLRGIQAENLYFADFSSEALPLAEDTVASPNEPHTRISLTRPLVLRQQSSPPRLFLKHTRSQEQLRIPPPRPPRSPLESTFVEPPVPPPRMSSRVSTRYDGFDPLSSTSLDRPQTSDGFRPPAHLAISPDGRTPPASAHAYSFSADMEVSAERRYSRVISSIPDDANWPLTCPLTCPTNASFESALPDVPEEDEYSQLARRSKISIASNNSSLRGSQSVPLLRQLAQSQGPSSQRPPSGASDTLGRFDLFAAQRALRAALNDDGSESLPRESWEDDIDYCYEHEAEADCEYAWDRPSLDASREEESVTPVEVETRGSQSERTSPAMLTPGHFDVPALSPASHISMASTQEAITPTVPAMPSSNFSLPRTDGQSSQRFLHVRAPSHASSFKESHGFNLSPSLLIPGSDYHRQMMALEADEYPGNEYLPAYEEPTLTMDTSTLLIQPRTSASTTGSNDSEHSGSERHISRASASTDLTRFTMSTASIEDLIPKNEPVPVFETQEAEPFHVRGKSEPMAVLAEEPLESRVLWHDFSRNGEPKLQKQSKDDTSAKLVKRKESSHFRRQRARTTSLSTPPPPGQYGLFPAVNISMTRI